MEKDRKKNRKTVQVKCDYCGKIFEKVASEVKRNAEKGRHNYCSRECVGKASTARQLGRKRGPATGKALEHIKEICGNRRDELTPFRYTHRCIRQRFQDVDVTIEDLKEQWEKQDGKCPYTGFELVLPENMNIKKIDFFHRASLDRIDSSKGYVKGNIQFISTPINLMKLTRSDQEVKDFLKEVAKFVLKDEIQ